MSTTATGPTTDPHPPTAAAPRAPDRRETWVASQERLRRRLRAWRDLAEELRHLPGPSRCARLRRLDAEVQEELLPTVALADELLPARAPGRLAREHRAIRHAARCVHHLATAGEVHPHLAWETVTSLHRAVATHLDDDAELSLCGTATPRA